MNADIFADPVVVWLGPVPITRTMLCGAATSVLLLCFAWFVARAVVRRPSSRLAALGRIGVRAVHTLVTDAVGQPVGWLEAFAGGLFLFIAGSALIGQLPGVVAPTANLTTTSALAGCVFLAVPAAGIASRGLGGYAAHYLRPNPLLLPLHVVSEFSRTVALALRLFGNMLSGHLIVALIVALVGPLVPVPLMALDLLIGLLQAYIFAILACVYIGAALRVGKEE